MIMAVPDFQVIQLKVTLKHTKPPIWRRVQVRSDISLLQLHDILQVVMGWTDSHLHQFVIRGKTYTVLDPDCDPSMIDETEVKLDEVIHAPRTKFRYDYDFGDGWEHELVVEKILPPDPATHYPVCLDGKLACPIEDSGGPWGYYEKLKIVKDPRHPDHADIVGWMPEDFDPEAFDRQAVNEVLRGM
jgi:hypothetical protein